METAAHEWREFLKDACHGVEAVGFLGEVVVDVGHRNALSEGAHS